MITTATPIDARPLINRALGHGVVARFIPTRTGFWWCEITLPRLGFERETVCCPGVTQMSAAVNAVKQAERLRRAVA